MSDILARARSILESGSPPPPAPDDEADDVLSRARRIIQEREEKERRRQEVKARIEAMRAGGEAQWANIQAAPQERPLAQLGRVAGETFSAPPPTEEQLRSFIAPQIAGVAEWNNWTPDQVEEEIQRRLPGAAEEYARYTPRFNRDIRNLGKAGVRAVTGLVDQIRGAVEAGGAALETPSPPQRQPAGMAGLSTPGMAVPYREEPNAPPPEPPIPVQALGEAIRHTAGYGPNERFESMEPQWAAREPGYIPEDFWQGMKEDPIRTLAINGIENLGPLAATMAATWAAGPAGGMSTAFAVESGAAYNEAKEAGASDEQAVRAAGATAAVNAILEYLPAGKAISRLAGAAPKREVLGLLRGVAEQAAAEGVTESVQELNNILVAGATYAEENDLDWEDVKRIGASGLIGAAMGGGVGAMTSAASGTLAETTTLQETSDEVRLQQGGEQLPDREADQQEPGSRPEPDLGRRPEARFEPQGDQEEVTAALTVEPTPPPASTPSAERGEGGAVSEPEVEILSFEEVDQPGEIASHAGQGGESVEAINRQRSGNRYFRVRPSGEVLPLIGVDAADARVGKGEAKVLVNPQGEVSLVDGRLSKPMQDAVDRMRAEMPATAPQIAVEALAPPEATQPSVAADEAAVEPSVDAGPRAPDPSYYLPEQPRDATAQGGFVGSATAAQPAPLAFSRPEVEEGFQRGRKGAPEEGILTRIKDTAVRAGQMARRELQHVPSGAKFAPFRESIRRLRTFDPSNEVSRQLNEVVSPLTDKQYELFQRKTLLDDLDVISREYDADTQLPFGVTPEDLATDKPRVDEAAEADPYVKRAVERSKEVWAKAREDYRSAAESFGMDTSFLDRRGESYLHHQVIEYALLDGKRIKKIGKPKGRGFQRELTGSIQDINLRYGEAQGQVLTQLALDAEMARQLKNVKEYSVTDRLKAEAKAASTDGKKVRWESLKPDGYDFWQPDEGSIFYLGQTVSDRIARRLLEEGNAGIRITPQDLKEALVVGGKKETWTLPTEIVETLNEISNRRTSEVAKVNQTVVRGWKKLMLLMPRRLFKYALRNVIGDTQKTTMGNPKAVLRFKQAAADLGSYVYGKSEPTQALKDWMARGGWQSGLFQQELEETEAGRQQRLRSATEMAGQLEKVKDVRKLPRRYFAWAGKHVSFVEAINRYANYLEYLGQMEGNPDGKPANFGASRADEVMALDDPRDRAYWLSNQLIGAYDQVSEMGQILRRHYVPFWSFQELNMRSHWGLLRNAVTNPERALSNAQRAGVITRTMTPMVAWRVAKLFGLTMAFEAFLHSWNYGLFDEEEDDLPLDIRRTPHIVLGRDDEGNVLYFNRLSVFHELREWFGVDEFGYSLMDYMDGRISAKQMFKEVAAVPGNKLLNSIGPVSAGGVKSIFELATRKTTFPEPRDIHDRWDYAFRTVGMEEEFREATGRPTPSGGYLASWKNAFIYSAEPGAAAYYDTLSAARRFRHSIGDDTQGTFFGAKTDALRNYKRALRYDQPEIAERYLRLYVAAGGTSRGFEQSLERMDPLSSVRKDDREAFEEWLTPDEKLKLEDATRYYEEVFGPDSPGNEEALELIERLEAEQDQEKEAA